jgi:hypothetical protein
VSPDLSPLPGESPDSWESRYRQFLGICSCTGCGARHDGKREWLTETLCMPCSDRRETQLDRIERKLDALLKALAEDDDQPATESLDGEQVPKPRQESRSL